jgi:hypothetical protein
MAKRDMRMYGAGALSGAGLALFVLYILSQAVSIDLTQPTRLAVGVVGLVLLAAGFFLRPRPAGTHADAEPGAAPDRRGM